jgi:hypothetical protein
MYLRQFFTGTLLAAYIVLAATGRAGAVIVAHEPFNALSDPVLWLEHTRAQLAFELAPGWMVRSCNYAYFHHLWIFAQTSRPEGMYILAYGSVWIFADVDKGQRPWVYLDNDENGQVDLIRMDHSCEPIWNPDDAFDGIFYPQPHPTPAQASIIHDLAVDLIRRELKIFGGREGFFKALAATGHGIQEQQTVMIPLLEALKANKQLR